MFQNAYRLAAGFTFPVVLSRLAISGACSSVIGSYVVINRDGWFVTAYHILGLLDKLAQQQAEVDDFEAKQAAINADASLDHKERRRRVNKLKRPAQDTTRRWSDWWSGDHIKALQCRGLEGIDLGVGRLEPFDPASVAAYPRFKNPAYNFEQGRSLCKLGFPFHSIDPIWDANANVFRFPTGALPMPRFPIDGIFTRIINVVPVSVPPLPFPLQLIETSTPGLRGQSGGPIFDVHGNIWAIQTSTEHLPLGFDPPVPDNPARREHQFLNVGRGVSAATIIGLLNELGIAYEMSAD